LELELTTIKINPNTDGPKPKPEINPTATEEEITQKKKVGRPTKID